MHQKGALPHPGGRIQEEVVKSMNWIPIETEPSDVVFFSALAPHFSEANTTNDPRRAMYLTYSLEKYGDLRDSYYKDKREKFPPMTERIPNKDYSEGAAIYNLSNPIE